MSRLFPHQSLQRHTATATPKIFHQDKFRSNDVGAAATVLQGTGVATPLSSPSFGITIPNASTGTICNGVPTSTPPSLSFLSELGHTNATYPIGISRVPTSDSNCNGNFGLDNLVPSAFHHSATNLLSHAKSAPASFPQTGHDIKSSLKSFIHPMNTGSSLVPHAEDVVQGSGGLSTSPRSRSPLVRRASSPAILQKTQPFENAASDGWQETGGASSHPQPQRGKSDVGFVFLTSSAQSIFE